MNVEIDLHLVEFFIHPPRHFLNLFHPFFFPPLTPAHYILLLITNGLYTPSPQLNVSERGYFRSDIYQIRGIACTSLSRVPLWIMVGE